MCLRAIRSQNRRTSQEVDMNLSQKNKRFEKLVDEAQRCAAHVSCEDFAAALGSMMVGALVGGGATREEIRAGFEELLDQAFAIHKTGLDS